MTRSVAQVREIATPGGPGRIHRYAAAAPRGTLLLGHGAGGGIGAPDLALLARELPADGYDVVLVEQPWRVAGRKVAGRPPSLDAAWVPIVAALSVADPSDHPSHDLPHRDRPLVVGGRSAGARVACRTAAEVGAAAVLCLSFPLHPPGKPERSRAEELRAPLAHGIPVRVVQGASDPWGLPGEIAEELGQSPWVRVAPGGHSFARNPLDVLAAVREILAELLTR